MSRKNRWSQPKREKQSAVAIDPLAYVCVWVAKKLLLTGNTCFRHFSNGQEQQFTIQKHEISWVVDWKFFIINICGIESPLKLTVQIKNENCM